MIKTYSIGQTWQERDIRVIELDARHYLQSKGIEEIIAAEAPAAKNGTKNATAAAATGNKTQSLT